MNLSSSPLLAAVHELPRFDAIRPEHVEPAIRTLIEVLERDLEQLEKDARPSWAELIEPLHRIVEPIRIAWGSVGHLMGVRNAPELRAAYEAVQPDVVRTFSRLAQSRPLYEAAIALRNSAGWPSLSEDQHRIVDKLILDAELSGVGLDDAARERFNAIQQKLAELSTKFSNHVLDATKAFALTLREASDVEGLSESLREQAAHAAREV